MQRVIDWNKLKAKEDIQSRLYKHATELHTVQQISIFRITRLNVIASSYCTLSCAPMII